MKGKMAIVGSGESVLAFGAAGVTPFSVSSAEEAEKTLKSLAEEYQIIFIVDSLAEKIKDFIARYQTVPYPIIISVPSERGGNGFGMKGIKECMEKALGVDILFNNNKG